MSEDLIMCVRTEDMEDPIDHKSRVSTCADCGADVWISVITDEYIAERRHRIVCDECFDKYGIESTGMKDDIPEETKEALRAEGIDVDEIYGE